MALIYVCFVAIECPRLDQSIRTRNGHACWTGGDPISVTDCITNLVLSKSQVVWITHALGHYISDCEYERQLYQMHALRRMWRIRNISTFGITATLRNAQLPKRAAGHAHLRPQVYLVAFDFWPPLMGCVFGAQLINCQRIDFFHFFFCLGSIWISPVIEADKQKNTPT